MMTFLPYSDFQKSAQCLDNKRLGKQRSEVLQILKALNGEYKKTGAWRNHPVTKMWRGFEEWLIEYGLAICDEWKHRGFKDTCREKIYNYVYEFFPEEPPFYSDFPKWINERLCASHRASLLAKNSEWYNQFGWKEKPEINYYYPI